jgi:hypothetical protein
MMLESNEQWAGEGEKAEWTEQPRAVKDNGKEAARLVQGCVVWWHGERLDVVRPLLSQLPAFTFGEISLRKGVSVVLDSWGSREGEREDQWCLARLGGTRGETARGRRLEGEYQTEEVSGQKGSSQREIVIGENSERVSKLGRTCRKGKEWWSLCGIQGMGREGRPERDDQRCSRVRRQVARVQHRG